MRASSSFGLSLLEIVLGLLFLLLCKEQEAISQGMLMALVCLHDHHSALGWEYRELWQEKEKDVR